MSQCLTCKKAMSCTLDWKNQGNWVSCTAYVQPVTNADRIRSMSDEELAGFLFEYGGSAPNCKDEIVSNCKSCRDCWLDWLNREEEE